jgi:hypothetical protein
MFCSNRNISLVIYILYKIYTNKVVIEIDIVSVIVVIIVVIVIVLVVIVIVIVAIVVAGVSTYSSNITSTVQ